MGTRYTNKDYVSRDNPKKKKEFAEKEKQRRKKLLSDLGLTNLQRGSWW